MFAEVAAYLVLAPIAGAVALAVWLGWGNRRSASAVPVEKERSITD